MSDRENKLRALLERVRASRPEDRVSAAGQAVEHFKTEAAAKPEPRVVPAAAPAAPAVAPGPAPLGPPISVPRTARAAAERAPVPPIQKPFARTSSVPPPGSHSPTRYSSRPPAVETPLSSVPAAARQSAPARQAAGPVPVRPQSVAPGHRAVVQATGPSEAPSAKTFGELLELTLSLRPD